MRVVRRRKLFSQLICINFEHLKLSLLASGVRAELAVRTR